MASVVILATLIGAFVRLFYVLQSDFPLNDGGMFYTMIGDLQAAAYRLPAFTSYNNANIPYAYPSLPFYLGGVLNGWLHIDLIQLLRFFPLVFSVLSIPAFYWLAKLLLKTDVQRGAAVFIFALFSPVYTWQIMGGGLTRSPGIVLHHSGTGRLFELGEAAQMVRFYFDGAIHRAYRPLPFGNAVDAGNQLPGDFFCLSAHLEGAWGTFSGCRYHTAADISLVGYGHCLAWALSIYSGTEQRRLQHLADTGQFVLLDPHTKT